MKRFVNSICNCLFCWSDWQVGRLSQWTVEKRCQDPTKDKPTPVSSNYHKSAQTMFNISFYNFNWHLIIWRAKVGLNLCRFYTFGLPKCLFFLLNIFEIINLSKVVFVFLWLEQNPAFLLLWVSEIQIEGCWRKHTNISNHWWVEFKISPSIICVWKNHVSEYLLLLHIQTP